MLKKLLILSVLSFSVFAQAKDSLIKMIKEDVSILEIQIAIQRGAHLEERSLLFFTPLIMAAKKSPLKIVKLFIEEGADVNAKNSNGETALMYASYYGRAAVVNLLLQAGADVNAKDKNGKTALSWAYKEWQGLLPILKEDYEETVQILKQAGATESSLKDIFIK